MSAKAREKDTHDEHKGAKGVAPTAVQSTRPSSKEDAHKTHDNQAQQRKVLEMNVKGGQAQRHPETVAGQHSTGSFTGENKKK
jgi:hypothetical protein